MTSRIALVTGAGRGIGRATALQFAGDGTRVAVSARSEDELASLAEEIGAAGGQCAVFPADLSDRGQSVQLIDRVEQHWGPVQILVNNAGIGSSAKPMPLVEYDDEFWDLTMAINVTAPYLLIKRTLPGMIASGWGRVVNVASINARVAALHGTAYAVSKHAVAGLTKATAKEAVEHGVTANAVCPGVTATKMNDQRLQYDAERLGTTFEALEAGSTPLGRRLRPEEIAAVIVFLASDAAAGVNGQLVNVCGGAVTQ